MERQETFARVLAPVALPGGCPLQPGQSIEPGEITVLGEKTVARMLRDQLIELRQRRASDLSGLVPQSALAERIEIASAELGAFRAALDRIAAGGTEAGHRSAPEARPGTEAPRNDRNLRVIARSLLALVEAHRELREDFDRLSVGAPVTRAAE